MNDDPLGLDPETMRRLGYQTGDMLVDRLSAVADGPVMRRADRPEMEEHLSEPPPEGAQGFDEILSKLGDDVCRSPA